MAIGYTAVHAIHDAHQSPVPIIPPYRVIGLLSLILGTGCYGPSAPVQRPVDSPATERLAAQVAIYDAATLANGQVVDLGKIAATSCKSVIWGPPATRENAVLQLKYIARNIGADGITQPYCTRGGEHAVSNCWESVHCEAHAVRGAR